MGFSSVILITKIVICTAKHVSRSFVYAMILSIESIFQHHTCTYIHDIEIRPFLFEGSSVSNILDFK
uniref:Uncharacterized protein n=1 Tax=Rhizophora mucronata TaxID=61149 RepID=A0A2P2IKE4_RHIMU